MTSPAVFVAPIRRDGLNGSGARVIRAGSGSIYIVVSPDRPTSGWHYCSVTGCGPTRPAVAAYAQFKQVLAMAVNDLEVYTDVKDPVVDLVIAVAEEWAEATGWTP